jgi:hypothetical protein
MLAMPTCALFISAGCKPVAYNIACEAPCDGGCVIRELNLFNCSAIFSLVKKLNFFGEVELLKWAAYLGAVPKLMANHNIGSCGLQTAVFWTRYAQLLAQYEGQYVTPYQGEVVDYDQDHLTLVARIEGNKPLWQEPPGGQPSQRVSSNH